MSDLVERLREVAERPDANYPAIMEQAAAEIERLRAALREIASGKYSGIVLFTYPPQDPAVNAARAALGEKE